MKGFFKKDVYISPDPHEYLRDNVWRRVLISCSLNIISLKHELIFSFTLDDHHQLKKPVEKKFAEIFALIVYNYA